MEKSKLRTTSNYNEIIDVIRECCQKQNSVMVWQNPIGVSATDEERIISQGRMFHYNSSHSTITLEMDDNKNSFLDLKHVLYVSSDEYVLLFKTDIINSDDEEVIIKVPHEMKVLERRTEPRTEIGADNRFKLDLQFEKKKIAANLINLSIGGAAILIKGGAHIWSEGDSLTVSKICDVHLAHSLKAEVRNIRSVELSENSKTYQGIRVGIQFESKLDNDTLEKILKKLPKTVITS